MAARLDIAIGPVPVDAALAHSPMRFEQVL
jgi:hypothetical protein